MPEAGKRELELSAQCLCNSVTDLKTAPNRREHPTLLFSILSSSCLDSSFSPNHLQSSMHTSLNILCFVVQCSSCCKNIELDQSSNGTQSLGRSLVSGKLFPDATGEIFKNVLTIFYMENEQTQHWFYKTASSIILKRKRTIYLYFNISKRSLKTLPTLGENGSKRSLNLNCFHRRDSRKIILEGRVMEVSGWHWLVKLHKTELTSKGCSKCLLRTDLMLNF